MFNGVLTTLLNSTLGKFLRIDEIKVGLSGIVELKNVELNAKTIETFLPVSLKLGRVGHLRIELGLLSPTKVTISDVYVVAALPKDGDVNVEELSQQLIQQKIETLLNWELLNFPEKQVESEKGTLMKAIDTLIDHITVSVERVHVVFEERGINAGVTVKEVHVFPVDDKDEQIVSNSDTTVVSRRKIRISGVGIYLNIDPEEAARGAAQHQHDRDEKQGNVQALTHGLYGTSTGAQSLQEYNRRRRAHDPQLALIDQVNSFKPEHSKAGFPAVTHEFCQSIWDSMEDPKWSWILVPFATTVHFNMWKSPLTKLQEMVPPKPSMEGIVDVGKLELSINHDQYQGVLTLMAQFLNNPATLAMIKLQTSRDTNELNKKDRSLLQETERNELIQDGMDYAQLYKLNFQGYPMLTEDQTKKINELEKKHVLTQLLTWRAVALKVVQIEYEQDDKPFWRQKPASGFFSLFGASYTAPKPVTTINPTLLRSFVEDPAALQFEEEKKTMQNVQANYIKMFFAANISAVAFSLVQPSREKILEFGIYDIGAEIRMRPQGMGIMASIDKLQAVDHLTHNALSRTFITKSASQSNQKFLTASISMGDKHINPEDGYDMVLATQITGVDILVNLPLLLGLGSFFAPPKHVAIASKAKNELMGSFSQLKNTNALSVFESRGRQKMDIQITSPTLIIPTSVTDPEAHVLVCRLGTLSVKATPPTLVEVKEQKVLMEKAAKDSTVLSKLTKDQQKQLFYDTFNISLYDVSVSIGDPKLTHCPNDSVYVVRPMQLDLALSMCLLQQNANLDETKDKDSKVVVDPNQPKSLSLADLTMPGMLIDLSLPSIDIQISPLKISRLLRLTKALLSALKLSQKTSDVSSSALNAETVIDRGFKKDEIVPTQALIDKSKPKVNPESTSMLVSVQLGRISLVIVNDLVPMFPVNVLFLSMEGLYCAVAMRALDMDVSMVLKSFYLQDCLNNYGGPNRFIVAGASRDLLSFKLNPDNERMMNHMLTHAFPYQDELPAEVKSGGKTFNRNGPIHGGKAQNITATAEANALQTKLSTKDSTITSAFLSCHVSLPQHTSPYYAFVSTLATAHFGQVVININRESIPALACFFAKQLLPNPAIFTPEDKKFGQVGLDFMQDIEWGDLDEDLQNANDQKEEQMVLTNHPSSPQSHLQQEQQQQQQQPPDIDPNLGFDPNLLKSGLDIAADEGNDTFGGNNSSQTLFGDFNNYNHTGFDMDRVMPLIHAPSLTVQSFKPTIIIGKPKTDLTASAAELDDGLKLLGVVKDFLDNLVEIDEHDYNLHFFGLIPGISPAYPSTMAQNLQYLKLMALYDQDESELAIAEGEDPLTARQEFRNEKVKLRNDVLNTELASLATTVKKLDQHLDFVAVTPVQDYRPSSPINCTSSQLLTLHRYANTKVLLQLGRLQERETVLKARAGSYEEKIEISSRINHYKSLLQYRRNQLLNLRNYERHIRHLRRLGCTSSVLCTDEQGENKQHRVGVFCMPKSFKGDSVSLQNALEHNNLEFTSPYDITSDPLYDAETNDAICPLIPANKLKLDGKFDQKYALVPLDVLARVTFGGVAFTLTTQNVPILQFNITPFTMGFGMHSHGMSIKLLIGTLSLRQPSGAMPTLTGLGLNKNSVASADNDYTNITRGFLNSAVQHQLSRHQVQQAQKDQKKKNNVEEMAQLNNILTTQLINLKQYIDTHYNQRTANNGVKVGFYPPGGTKNSLLVQKYARFVENRQNYRLDYPEIIYTAPPSSNNTIPQLSQVVAESDMTDGSFYMLNLAVEMHAQEMIIFDDTDEFDYYSLQSIHHMTGFDDLATGLAGIGEPQDLFHSAVGGANASHRTALGSQHSAYSLRGKKVSQGPKTSTIPGLGRGSSLLLALNSRNKASSTTLSSLAAIHKANSGQEGEVVNTAVVTELPFNVPAFIMTQNPSVADQFDLGNSRIIPNMVIKGSFRGIRLVVCYKSVDNLLKYIEGLDKCMEAVMSNNSYHNTVNLVHNRIKAEGNALRSASLLSHLSAVESAMASQPGTAMNSRRGSHVPSNPHSQPSHGDGDDDDEFVLLGQTQKDGGVNPLDLNTANMLMVKKAHVGAGPSDDFKTAATNTKQPDFYRKPTAVDELNQKVQKKLVEIGQAVNNLNNSSAPEAPRACPLLMDLDITISDLAISIPISSTSFELVSITLDKLAITSSTSLTHDTSITGPVEGATFFASSNESNTAQNASGKTMLSQLIQQQHQFQRQTSISKIHAATAGSGGAVGSLPRGNSLLGRENSMSMNSESVFQRLRAGSLLNNEDDDEFFDAEELDENDAYAQVLAEPVNFSMPQTYMAVPTVPTDSSIFLQLAEHKENSKLDGLHTLGKPTQTYDYRNLQVQFSVALTGITITTLVLVDGRGVREQSAAPRITSIIDTPAAAAGVATPFGESSSPGGLMASLASPTPDGINKNTDSTPHLQMLDLMCIGDITIDATHFTYLPFIILSPPAPGGKSSPEITSAMCHTAHTFYPRMPLPDWAVSMGLDNVDFIISQPQLSLLLSLISTHSVFPGNLSEKSILRFPAYQPATPSNSTTTISLAQIQFYHPVAAGLSINQLKSALQILTKAEAQNAMSAITSEQAQIVLQTLQKTNMGSKLSGFAGSSAASSIAGRRKQDKLLNSRLSRIGSHMAASRLSYGSTIDEDNIDVWVTQQQQNAPVGQINPEQPKKGLGVSVCVDIGRFSLQVVANPSIAVAESLCILVSTKTRLNMLPDGTIALTATIDDLTIVNAELPTNNPSTLRESIYALETERAILRPMSTVVAVSITPNTFNHSELLTPLPKLYTPANAIKVKRTRDGKQVKINSMFQPTRQPGQVSQQVISVSCVVTDMYMKVSYSDYDMVMSVLGTLSASVTDDFSTMNPTVPQTTAVVDQRYQEEQLGLSGDAPVSSTASQIATTQTPTEASTNPVIAFSDQLLHSMGDMNVTFALPTLSILLVNDSPGFPLPFMRIEISDIGMNLIGFAHRRNIQLQSGVKIDFHNGALVAWEPLLEPSRYEITVVQSVTHPMQIKVTSVGKINLNVTRAMMEGLAQSLTLLASAQAAQQKKLQNRLQQMSGIPETNDDIDDIDEGEEDHHNPSQMLTSFGDEVTSFISSTPQLTMGGTSSAPRDAVNRRYNQLKKRLVTSQDTTLVDTLVRRLESDKLQNFSFFRLDNHTEFPMYYQFGAQIANSDDIEKEGGELVDVLDVQNEVLDSILDMSNDYYNSSEVLNKTALALYRRIFHIQHGGYLPGSPQFTHYTNEYKLHITEQRQRLAKPAQPKSDLSRLQQRRLFKFNLFYTAWAGHYGDVTILKTLFDGAADNSDDILDKIDKTSHRSLPSLSSIPLFFNQDNSIINTIRQRLRKQDQEGSDRQTIGDLLSEQHRQALDMIHASSKSKTTSLGYLSKAKNSNDKSLSKQSAAASQKLLSLQIAGYEPIHNIQVETVGSQSYMLTPGRAVAKDQQLEALSVLVHVTVVQGIKVVSVRNAKAMVNLTDSVLEVCYGHELHSKTIVFPGDTFYLPLSTQTSHKVSSDEQTEQQQQTDKYGSFDSIKNTASFVAIRPITLVPHGRSGGSLNNTNTRSKSRQMIKTVKQNDISYNSYSSYRYSYPTNLDSLINGSFLVSEAVLDQLGENYQSFFPGQQARDIAQQNNKNADFITVVQRWRSNGLTYWALCPPFSITNLLSERALITLSTKTPQVDDGKKSKKDNKATSGVAPINFGTEIIANVAPSHSLRCYSSIPSSTSTSAKWIEQNNKKRFAKLQWNDNDIAQYDAFNAAMIDWTQFSARPDPQQGLYMSLSIPSLGLTTRSPQLISKTGQASNYHLYFDLVHQKALENLRENKKLKDSDLRTLTVHCEVNQSNFLLNQKTTSAVNVPNVSTAHHNFLQAWQAQAESSLLSFSNNELEHIAATSLHLLPSAIAAGVKMVLYTPYWIFDTTNLGLLIAEGTKISDLKQLTPTQYDSPINASNHDESSTDMYAKLRTWNAVSDQSAQANLLEETGKLIAIGTKLSSHISTDASMGTGIELPRETVFSNPTTGGLSVLAPQSPNFMSSQGDIQLASIGEQNQEMTKKLDEKCYVKAAMFSSHQHQQIPSLRVVARLSQPSKIISSFDNQYPPQSNKDLRSQAALTFISDNCYPFSLDAVGVNQTLEFKGLETHQLMLSGKKDRIMYCVAVLIRSGQDIFKRTKQVFFSPRVVIVNKLPLPMLLRQHCLDDLASLKTQASQITGRFSLNRDGEHNNGVRNRSVTLNLLESTPDHHVSVDTQIEDPSLLNQRDPLYREGKFHATAALIEKTEQFLPTDQTETLHWPHFNEEKLLSFKLLTQDDPFTHIIEEEAVQVMAKSLRKIKNAVTGTTNTLIKSTTTDSTHTTVSGERVDGQNESLCEKELLLDSFDLRSIACPLPNDSAYSIQSDGHSVISAIPNTATHASGTPINHNRKTRQLKQQTPWDEGVWGWSGYFDPTQVGDQTIIVRNPITGKSLIVKIRIILTSPDIRNASGNTITVIFEAQDLVFPKYRIENKTCSDTLRIAQAGSQEWLTLRPYDTTVYTWDQPLITGLLQVDVISGSVTIHKEYALDELGSKGTITVPGEASNALNLLSSPGNQTNEYDENGKEIKQTRAQRKTDHEGEMTLYHQRGGVNPIVSNQSKRSTHTVFVYVRAEGPTRVLVISDFPAANQDVDLLTSQLLATPDVKSTVQSLYDQCRIGIRGADVGLLLQKWNRNKDLINVGANTNESKKQSEHVPGDAGQLAPTNHLGLTEKDIPGPHGLRLLDETLAARAQTYESEEYLDEFCSQIAVINRASCRTPYQALVQANLTAQQFGYEEFNQRDQLSSQIAKLSQLYPGFDVWDSSLSEEDIAMLSQEKGGEYNTVKKLEKNATKVKSTGSGEMSSVASIGADALPLTAEELVDLVKVRAQTIKSIVVKHNNVQYQTSVVAALAKWQLVQANPELDGSVQPVSTPVSPDAQRNTAMFTTSENPSGQPTPPTIVDPTLGVVPTDKIVLSREELSLIANLKDDVAYLMVRVNEARWLTPASLTGLSDCYAMITFNNQSYKTHVAVDTTNPFWASEMFFKLDGVLLRDLRNFQSHYLAELKLDPTATELNLPTTTFNDLSLRVAVFHQNTLLSDTFLGGVILSSLDNIIVSQLHHETTQLQLRARNLASNLDPNTSTTNNNNEDDNLSAAHSPVVFLNRWFKLHALRHNKLLYGQCQLSFGFVSNELVKQQLLLYELEQDLLEHILLLTRVTFKYRAQLQSIDVGVMDLNSLYLQPQLQIPLNPAFIQAVRAKDMIKKSQRLLKKVKYKQRPPKNGFETKLTMTSIGPIRYPVIDLPKLHKKRPHFFRNVNLYPNVDPNAPQQAKHLSAGPKYPRFVPIPLIQEQTTTLLTDLANAAVKVYNQKIEDQQEVSVCISLEDIAVDLKHVYDCLLKEDKLLPNWIPTKIVALLQCNGHVSKLDLFDFILPEINQFTKMAATNNNSPVQSPPVTSPVSTSPLVQSSQQMTSESGNSIKLNLNALPESPESSGIGQAVQKQKEQNIMLVNHLPDDDDDIDSDYATLLAQESEEWIRQYGISLSKHLGPNQGDITILPHVMTEEDEDEENSRKVDKLRESTSSPSMLQSSMSGLGNATLSRNVNLTLNKFNGKHELLTFTIPLSLIKSYVEPLNDVYGTSDTDHLSPHDIPALTMTLLCEVQQNKAFVTGTQNISTTQVSSPTQLNATSDSGMTRLSATLEGPTSPSQHQKGEETGSVFDAIGFSTPLKASVHLADIDVPLVDLQYVDIYNPQDSTQTRFDDDGVPYEVDGLGRRRENLILESHYYFARRGQFYRTDADRDIGLEALPMKLLERFTPRIAKPPTPIANLSESEIRQANNVYNTRNPNVLAAYNYNEHLQQQLSNYMNIDAEHAFTAKVKERQSVLIKRASEKKKSSSSSSTTSSSTTAAPKDSSLDQVDVEEYFWSNYPVSTTVNANRQVYGIDADEFPLLCRVPLSPVRATIKAHIQSSKPLIERPQMAILVDVPHFGLSLVDSTLGKADELLYISARGVVIDMEDSVTQRAIEFKVGNFQIDQCIEFGDSNATEQKESVQDSSKIIFGPSENALSSGQPFVHISINQTKTHPQYPVQVYKYASVLIQEMSIRVEEALIWHLLRFSNDILPALSSSVGSIDSSNALAYLVCDQRILFQPLNTSSTALFYFSVLHIQPISLFLTFKINPDVRSSADDMSFNPIQTVLSAATGILGSIDAAPICMASLLISDASGDITTLVSPIVQFYVSQGIREGYKVLGSVEFLGNPVSLVSGVGSGVKDFFYEPAQGLVSSPKDFGTGLVKGSASLLRSVTTGLFGAASKVTGSVGKGLSTLTMDSSFQSSRRARNNRKIKHAGDGLLQGTKALSYGLFSGISGIVMNPLEGARSGGAKGFIIGVATGLSGVVTKTASGAMDLISLSLQGLTNTFKLFDEDIEPTRARFPRFISSYGSMRDYNVTFALGRFVLDVVQPPKLDGVAKKIFSAITGLGGKNVNVQRENDFTVASILEFIDNSSFYDIDLISSSLGATNLTSVLVELESLLSSTIYGATFHPQADKAKKTLSSKELDRLKNIHYAINQRLKFLSGFASEDLITCHVVNNTDQLQSRSHSAQLSTIDGVSPHATLIVLTTKRLIAVSIKDVLTCSREGGELTGGGVKCNILIDHLVDLSVVLSEGLPDTFTPKIREINQQQTITKVLKAKQQNGLMGITGLLPGQSSDEKNAIAHQKGLLKQQQAKAKRTVNHLIITHTTGNDLDKSTHVVKLPILNTLECQSTLLSLQSYMLRPRVLIVKYGDRDISQQFSSQFYGVPATPHALLALNNSSTEFIEAINLGKPRGQNVHKPKIYPFSNPTLRSTLQRNQCYYPSPQQIQAVLDKFHYQVPKKVVSTQVHFDESNIDNIHTTIRTFLPTSHGSLPITFDYNGFNNLRKRREAGLSQSQTGSLFDAHNFNIIDTQELLSQSDNSPPTSVIEDYKGKDVHIVNVPEILPLHSYPQTTLRTTPFALTLRKPTNLSVEEWNKRILLQGQKALEKNDAENYRTKILSITFTVGSHVVTRQFTVFDESIILL